jgi:hypothetical protein
MISGELVTFAADWWASKFNHPIRITHSASSFAVSPDYEARKLGAILSQRAMKQPLVTPEQIAAFRVALAAEIRGETPTEGSPLDIRCNYEPLNHLARALRSAGINPQPLGVSVFPTKTVMLIYPDRINAKAGYGEPMLRLFPSPTPRLPA